VKKIREANNPGIKGSIKGRFLLICIKGRNLWGRTNDGTKSRIAQHKNGKDPNRNQRPLIEEKWRCQSEGKSRTNDCEKMSERERGIGRHEVPC